MSSRSLIIFITFFLIGVSIYFYAVSYFKNSVGSKYSGLINDCIQKTENFCKVKVDDKFVKSLKPGSSTYQFKYQKITYNCDIVYEKDIPLLFCKK